MGDMNIDKGQAETTRPHVNSQAAAASPEGAEDGDAIAQRMRFLEISPPDVDNLRHLHTLLEPYGETFATSFYQHLLSFPHLRTLLPDEQSLVKLRKSQADYFLGLTAGDYGADYVAHRRRIGQVHQRIGLQPEWYIGAYRKYLADLMPLLWQRLDGQPERFLACYNSLLKIVLFDIGLALDSYFEADRNALIQLKEYAEGVVCKLPTGLIVLDQAGSIRNLNEAARAMLGVDPAVPPAGLSLATLLPQPEVRRALADLADNGSAGLELTLGRAAGERIIEASFSALSVGSQRHTLIMLEDISHRRHDEAALFRFRAALDASSEAIYLIDRDAMRFIDVNTAGHESLGFSREEILSMGPADINPLFNQGALAAWLDNVLAHPDGNDRFETLHRRKDGSTFPVEIALRGFASEGRVLLAAVARDISERKEAEARLLHMATHDTLTDLPNRALLEDRIAQAIAYAERSERQVAVLFIDLDRFKTINDSLGHGAGDRLLSEVAEVLRQQIRKFDTLARLGGDEFVVVLNDLTNEADAIRIAQGMLDTIARPRLINGHEITASASIGACFYPRDGQDPDSLLRNADTAMYRAKDMGRNGVQCYAPEMNAHAIGRLRLEGDLRRALERGEFTFHYQPQVDLDSGRIIAVEALLRWHHPQHGLVSPAEFIPLCEETGLIIPLTEWGLTQVAKQVLQWREEGIRDLRVAVNLSPRQFRQQDLIAMIDRALPAACKPLDWLELEITEGVLMENPEDTARILHQLRERQIRLAVDDFGTGYSSLNYLKRFPLDALKIDRSFVGDLENNRDSAAIAAAVTALSHKLGLEVVAEGVENEAQLKHLRELRCDLGQGYLLGRPMPADELRRFLMQEPNLRLSLKERAGPALLLVDDEPGIHSALARLFRGDGYRILRAANGQEAMALLEQEEVGVIISDNRMPGMSGVALLSQVRERWPDTVRMILSGYTEVGAITDSVNQGAVYKFLSKPWDDKVLRESVTDAFRLYGVFQENRRLSRELRRTSLSLQRWQQMAQQRP
jgi:diguanylate cyclase (GGDEF)-like protein/PAS domain S-box-containing protein